MDTTADVRYHTGVGELDRVLGGGLVRGSIVLLGGEPGIGKTYTAAAKSASTSERNTLCCMFPVRNPPNRSSCGRSVWA